MDIQASSRRSGRQPLLDVFLGGAVAAGVIGALDYLYDMVKHQQRACPYCLVRAAAHFATVPLVVPDAPEGARSLGGRMSHGRCLATSRLGGAQA